LEQGISVARILAAVDETAERRRKKQTRSRLSLTACRRSIEKSRKKSPTGESAPSSSQQTVQMDGYACALEEMVVPASLDNARNVLIHRIRELDGSDDPEWAATEAVSACRIFHEAAWAALAAEHDALRDAAMEELAALKNVLSADAFAAAVDEVAHDMVRRQTPLVSAREVWDRVSAV
jgi:hypothetical protein